MTLHPLTLIWRYGLDGGLVGALNAALEAGHTVRVELPCSAVVEASTGAAHVVASDGPRLIRWSEHPDYVDGRHAPGEVAWYVAQLVEGRPLPQAGSRMSQPMQDRAWAVQQQAEHRAGRKTTQPGTSPRTHHDSGEWDGVLRGRRSPMLPTLPDGDSESWSVSDISSLARAPACRTLNSRPRAQTQQFDLVLS